MELPPEANRLVYCENARYLGKPAYLRVSRQEMSTDNIMWTVSCDPDEGLIRLVGEPDSSIATECTVRIQKLGNRAGYLHAGKKESEKVLRSFETADAEVKALQADVADRHAKILVAIAEELDSIKVEEAAARVTLAGLKALEFEFPIDLGARIAAS